MLLTKSSSGTGCCSRRYTFRRCRRNRSSNSASWSDEWSSPYHQNQSLPSAISTSSRARSTAAPASAGPASRAPRGRRPAGSRPAGRRRVRSRCRSSRRSTSRERSPCRSCRARRRAGFGHRDRPKLGMAGEPPVKRAEERAAAALEMLPGVLAVQDDRDERLSPAGRGRVAPAGLRQPRDEIVGRRVGRPAGIDEPDRDRTARGRGTRRRPSRRRRARRTGA